MNHVQCFHEFFHVVFVGLLYRHGYAWFGECYRHQFVVGAFAIEGIVGVGIFEFDRYANVSGAEFLHGNPFFAIGHKQLSESFYGAIGGIGQFVASFKYARADLEVGQKPNSWFRNGFVDENRSGQIRITSEGFAIGQRQWFAFNGGRTNIVDEPHHPA